MITKSILLGLRSENDRLVRFDKILLKSRGIQNVEGEIDVFITFGNKAGVQWNISVDYVVWM